jgi:hypothetical protein
MSSKSKINYSYSEYYKNRLQKHDDCFREIINKIPKQVSIYRKKRDYTEAFSETLVYTRFSDSLNEMTKNENK